MPFTRLNLDQIEHAGGVGTVVSDEELIQASGVLRTDLTPIVADTYTTSAQVLTGTWTNLSFGVARIFDPEFIPIIPTGIQITIAGIYEITASVTTNKTSGNQKANTGVRLALNNLAIPGTIRAMYNRNNAEGRDSATSHCIISLVAGNIITVQVILISGQNTVQAIADGCSFMIKKLR